MALEAGIRRWHSKVALEDGLACNYRERNANLFGYRNDVSHKLRVDVRRPIRLIVSMHPHVSNMHRDVIRNVRELLTQCARCLLATPDTHYQGGGRFPRGARTHARTHASGPVCEFRTDCLPVNHLAQDWQGIVWLQLTLWPHSGGCGLCLRALMLAQVLVGSAVMRCGIAVPSLV